MSEPNLKLWLEQRRDRLESIASQYVTTEQLIRLACLAATRQPQLATCSPESILKSLMDAAALGIRPGGLNGRGYLVPRMNRKTGKLECQFDPGWRGIVDIARRSKTLRTVDAHVVYERELADGLFSVDYGRDPPVQHQPYLGTEDRGPIVAAYCTATFVDGTRQVEVLTRSDLAKIRACSTSKAGPWQNWEDEMARKSAVRRAAKYWPVEAEIAETISVACSKSDDAQGQSVGPQRQLTSFADAISAPAALADGAHDIDGVVDNSPTEPVAASDRADLE